MKLAVFATYGSSLASWKQAGILDRELSLYREHALHGAKILFLSYGNREDYKIAERYEFLEVLPNKWNIHPRIYGLLAPILHHKELITADLFKTNQLYGAHVALRAARLCRKKLLVRQGYGHYEHRVEEFGEQSKQAIKAFKYESTYLTAGESVVFTTNPLAARAIDRYRLPPDKVHVIPNYIDPDIWTPCFNGRKNINGKLHLIFYGRFTEQKNLFALISAVAKLNVKLTLIGEGPKEEKLRAYASSLAADCVFIGRQQQQKLRSYLDSADVFVLPSIYEGHPKALIESMAYGMPILGARSPGISEMITDNDTGILADPHQENLEQGIIRFINLQNQDRMALGKRAREWAMANFSVAEIAKKERALCDQLLQRQ